ncbi:enoyl-CoA hydratase/isomerase family protein [Kerstersia similis]|uniref:enoyl-CoA hydratase/isomerase family protein n=1 Tax=Kerstersia similis TaxID=206505 RepID=UPI0039EFB9B8
MSQELVLTRFHAGIAEIQLNRPSRHNALVPALLDALLEALDAVRADEPRAIVLAAQGKSFSSGGDVQGFHAVPRQERRNYARQVVGGLNEVILTLLQLPCPTVAAVHGLVTGGSVGLALACDLAIGGPQTSFAPWYTAVGFSPDGGWTTLMPERIGRARALSVQLLNERLDAQEATRLGLLHQLAPDTESVLPLARQMATRMAAGRPGSVRHTLTQGRPDPQIVAAGLARELQHFLEQIDTEEAARGMQDFLGITRR